MKKFFFRLETLLRVRKTQEGKVERDLAHAEQKLCQLKEKEKMLAGQIEALMEEIQKKREKGDLLLQETYHQILDHLNVSLQQARQALAMQSKQVEGGQKLLKRAVQERKVIEKIKEKHYAGWCSRASQNEGELN